MILQKKLHPNSNSIGFLLRHMGEVERVFAKNVLGLDIQVMASTIGQVIHDIGKYTVLQTKQNLLTDADSVLEEVILR